MSFWTVHGYFGGLFFILLLAMLPRFTTLVFLALSTGLVAWITEPFGLTGSAALLLAIVGWAAWVLVPRFLIAVLATALYWHTNPILCFGAWAIAFVMLDAKQKTAKEKEAGVKGQAKTGPAAPNRTRKTAQQWWDILGVSPSASVDAIKSAYRRVAKATHPDTAPDGKGDTEKFRKASEAYQKALKQNGK